MSGQPSAYAAGTSGDGRRARVTVSMSSARIGVPQTNRMVRPSGSSRAQWIRSGTSASTADVSDQSGGVPAGVNIGDGRVSPTARRRIAPRLAADHRHADRGRAARP